jgi:hypothetical protein
MIVASNFPARPGGSTGTSHAPRRVSDEARRDARGSLLLTTGTARFTRSSSLTNHRPE